VAQSLFFFVQPVLLLFSHPGGLPFSKTSSEPSEDFVLLLVRKKFVLKFVLQIARVEQRYGINHPDFQALLRGVGEGHLWSKLSGTL
jgi:hypothetical protein